MSKYLRTVTKIDGINQKVILMVDSCTDCPLMKFHQQSCLATCRAFESGQGNIVDDFVLDYNVTTGKVIGNIKIPEWCKLADLESQMDFDTKTYTISGDKLLTSNAIVSNDLPVHKASELNMNEDGGVMDFLPVLVASSVLNDISGEEAYERAYAEYDDYEDMGFAGFESSQNYIPSVENKFGLCSLCGEEDETVNRNTNHGMCDECWKVSFDNDERKKQAYINNFRLKRGEPVKMESFNLSVLKADNLKIKISI